MHLIPILHAAGPTGRARSRTHAIARTNPMHAFTPAAAGQRLSFSEQQLIDCAWQYGTSACRAGDPWGALQYVVDAGGIAEEGTYPYTAEPGFCRTLGGGGNQSSAAAEEVVPLLVGRFSQVLQVPPRDDKALMEVLLRHGPVSVAIDPQPDFIFYSDGVYFNRKCGTAVEDLTHGVVLMGYGTTDDGVEYWVIKNRNEWTKAGRRGNAWKA
ncbi:hypothetical protein PLESTF_001832500 [Pleodorina starrii]|nr:hypothetical protein PLESTF_001832500 [Pleodorina starrii]